MKYIIPPAIYLALFFGAGYLLLKFFSGLTGVDMFNAFAWGFKAKKFEIVLPLILCYLIAITFFLAIITTPVQMSTAGITQKGGLAGYQDDDYMYKYLDPMQGGYLEVKHYNPPPASGRFDEAFPVVSFYKPLFSGHYQNVSDLSLPVSIIKMIFFLIGAVPLYFILSLLAKEFGKQMNPPLIITQKLICGNFAGMTGLSAHAVIWASILLLAVISSAGFLVSRMITVEHKRLYGTYSAEYRADILKAVSPGKKVTGRIIRRESITVKEYATGFDDEHDMNKNNVKHIPAQAYTVEFSNILKIPVYLNFQLAGDESTNKFIAELGSLFENKKSSVPLEKKDTVFIVNDNYGISLPGQEQQE